MGLNLTRKIIDEHLVDGDPSRPGNEIGIRIDQVLTPDATGVLRYLQFESMGLERVRVSCPNMGGGFGNKGESRLGLLVAVVARQTGRPARLEYSRAEEFVAGRNRQSSVNHLRIGVRQDGTPTAIDMQTVMNAGAYVASGTRVTRRTGQGALYLYTCPHAHFTGATAYTNRPAGRWKGCR